MAASVARKPARVTYRRPLALVLGRGLRTQWRGIGIALVATWLGIALAIDAAGPARSWGRSASAWGSWSSTLWST